MNRCLNCNAELNGAFCASCGQRSAPANPTVSELVGDAWNEMSGYDGRIAATFKNLLRPGQLTVDYLQGRRARYLSPVRLYLIVSVIYFLVAATTPITTNRSGASTGLGGLNVGIVGSDKDHPEILTAEDRAELAKDIDRQSWLIRRMVQGMVDDPVGFRSNLFTIMPRVFFALLPVFAAIVALFYRNRRFPVALVYAVHVHAFAFVIFTISELSKWVRLPIVVGVVGVVAAIIFAIYALSSLRAVFGGGWPITIAKAAGIGAVYLVASMPAFLIMLLWAALV
jgi:hypothetical protein